MCTCGAFWQTMSNVEDICFVPFPFRYLNLFNNILYRDMPLHHIRCSFLSSFFYEQMFAFSKYNSENCMPNEKNVVSSFLFYAYCITAGCILWQYGEFSLELKLFSTMYTMKIVFYGKLQLSKCQIFKKLMSRQEQTFIDRCSTKSLNNVGKPCRLRNVDFDLCNTTQENCVLLLKRLLWSHTTLML